MVMVNDNEFGFVRSMQHHQFWREPVPPIFPAPPTTATTQRRLSTSFSPQQRSQ
jgi:hypothetical protein